MATADEKLPHAYQTASPSSNGASNGGQSSQMSIGRYVATRIPTLKPAFDPVPNPFKTLALLNFHQWMFFLVAFLGWTW